MTTFKTQQTTFAYKDVKLQVTTVTNFDELYEALIQKGLQHEDVADERIPYWAELWPSAIGMSKYLIDNSELLSGKKTIEIGAGLGLPAMVAANFGATVLCTDYLADAVDFSKKNAAQNNILSIDFATFDWRNCNNTEQYDIIIASDVAYERKMLAPLLTAYKKLSHEDSIILMSDPNRYIATDFFSQLTAAGFYFEKTNYLIDKSNISVYKIQVKEK